MKYFINSKKTSFGFSFNPPPSLIPVKHAHVVLPPKDWKIHLAYFLCLALFCKTSSSIMLLQTHFTMKVIADLKFWVTVPEVFKK